MMERTIVWGDGFREYFLKELEKDHMKEKDESMESMIRWKDGKKLSLYMGKHIDNMGKDGVTVCSIL